MTNYKKYETAYGHKMIMRTDDNGDIWTFEENESNADYQRYLKDTAEQAPTVSESKK